jgi:hypothetical protein
MTEDWLLAGFTAAAAVDEYLKHRYKAPERYDFPLPDETFVSVWDAWLGDRNGAFHEGAFPEDIRDLLSGEGVKVWLEATPAGRIPVVYAKDRRAFGRLIAILSADDEDETLPASVNAFTVPCSHPAFEGHRVICLTEAGYSALSGENVGMGDEEWMEKSAAIRLRHECCHYFTLRALGGMKNHALDEIVADCVAQLSVFGRFDASLQRKFFGLEDGGRISPGCRFGFYVKGLPENAVIAVGRKVNEALERLESYLEKNAEIISAPRAPELIIKLSSLGIEGIAELC